MQFMRPLFSASDSLKRAANVVSYAFFDKVRLEDENENLREMVENLKGGIERSEILKKENEELLGALSREPQQKIFARVVLSPPRAAYDTFLIDVGSDNGIHVGMSVVSPGGVYLGTIGEVYPKSSKVAQISVYSRETNVYLENSGTPAIAFGMGGDSMKLSLPGSVPGLELGERVLSASGEHYLVGFVEKIENKQTDTVQAVHLRLPLNVLNLRSVFVIF